MPQDGWWMSWAHLLLSKCLFVCTLCYCVWEFSRCPKFRITLNILMCDDHRNLYISLFFSAKNSDCYEWLPSKVCNIVVVAMFWFWNDEVCDSVNGMLYFEKYEETGFLCHTSWNVHLRLLVLVTRDSATVILGSVQTKCDSAQELGEETTKYEW